MSFTLFANTPIVPPATAAAPVAHGVAMLRRDLGKTLCPADGAAEPLVLRLDDTLPPEQFLLRTGPESHAATLYAADDLGFVYGLLFLSEQFLGVQPFWFWLDQQFVRRDCCVLPDGDYTAPQPRVKYRGWFINDEVLLMTWKIGGDPAEPWRMCFEALLRCGGNLVIPGTDQNAHRYRALAAEYGLWLTHHHAEPLGAEMFARAYPGQAPNIAEHPEQFEALWEDAVQAQKNNKVVWNVGFRGQGDTAFWNSDTSGRFDTPEKRGALIGEVIAKQCALVRKYVKNPVFCTNLYGEITELYEGGYLDLPGEIIRVCADNGFGRMVTRRQEGHNARLPSLNGKDRAARRGIYYHVSFYDLQAAAHMTMLPNSVDFVNAELDDVTAKGAMDFWIVNCSNIRPHTYYLDALRKKWYGETVGDTTHSKDYAAAYYGGSAAVAACLAARPASLPQYGPEPDEHCGEQFYTENVRLLVNQYIVDKTKGSGFLHWLTGPVSLDEQMNHLSGICRQALPRLQAQHARCQAAAQTLTGPTRRLFEATVLLDATLHLQAATGVCDYAAGWAALQAKDYLTAFLAFGRSAECFDGCDAALRGSEYGVWQGFYENDCFADFKHTAFMVRKMMALVREYGDSPRHEAWYRDATYSAADHDIMTLFIHSNHLTDWQLYLAFRAKL